MIKSVLLSTLSLFSVSVSAMERDSLSQHNHKYMPLNDDEDDESGQSGGESEFPATPEPKAQENDELKKLGNNSDESVVIQMYHLGRGYYRAKASSKKIKEKNLQTARLYLSQAAQNGQPDAMNLLGEMWERGEGGYIDLFEAERLYTLAGNGGVPEAKLNLANLYFRGGENIQNKIHPNQKFQPNIDKAIKLYGEVAEQGDLRGDFGLARAHFKSRVYGNAIPYFVKICQSDQAERVLGKLILGQAKTALANLYWLKGYGSFRDAEQLYEQAIALGNKDAPAKLKELRQAMAKKKKKDGGQPYSALVSN